MSNESVKFVIEGVDKFSPTLAQVEKQLDKTGKAAKSFGGIFNVLGAIGIDVGPIGKAGVLIGEAAEKAKGLSGSIQSASKASVYFGAAIAGVAIGKMLADWISQTSEYKRMVEETIEFQKNGQQLINEKLSEHVRMQLQIAELAETPEEKLKIQQAELARVNELWTEQEKELANAKKRLEEVSHWYSMNDAQTVEVVQARVEAAQSEIDNLRRERKAISDAMAGENQNLTKAKEAAKEREKIADAQKQVNDQILKLQRELTAIQDPEAAARAEMERLGAMQGVTDEQRSQLMLAHEATQAAKEKLKADQESEQAAKAMDDKQKSLVNSLEMQLFALQHGADAAEEYRLSMEGVSAETRAQVAAIREQITAEQQREDDAKKEEERIRREKEATDGYIESLEMQKLALEQGADAAAEMQARKRGVTEEAIKQGRVLRDEIKALEEQEKKNEEEKKNREEEAKKAKEATLKESTEVGQLQAFEGRLASRGTGDPLANQAKKTEQLVNIQKEVVKIASATLTVLTGIQANTAVSPETI
jgi:hypothetical protein